MATVKITSMQAAGGLAGSVPMLKFAGTESQTQTMSTTTSSATSTVIGRSGRTVYVGVSGGNVRCAVKVGDNPNATSLYHYIIHDGGSMEFFCPEDDTRFAFRDL